MNSIVFIIGVSIINHPAIGDPPFMEALRVKPSLRKAD